MKEKDNVSFFSGAKKSTAKHPGFITNILKKAFRLKSIDQALHESESRGQALKRCLNVYELTAMGVGSTVGAGIFVLCGVAYRDLAGPSIVVAFILAGLTSLFASLCYAEFAARLPLSGSAYLYAYASLGEIVAFIIGWNLVLEYSISAAMIARGWAGYVNDLVGGTLPAWLVGYEVNEYVNLNALSPILIILLTFIISAGIKESATINLVMTSIKCFIVVFVICAGAGVFNSSNFEPFTPYGISGMFRGAGTIFFAYVGFDVVAAAAEEAREPQRDLPRAIVGSLIICTALYVAVSIVLTGMVPAEQVNIYSPLSSAFGLHGMDWAKTIVNIGAFVGLITTTFVTLVPQPRIFYSMARDGLLFQSMAKLSQRFHSPVNATILTGVIGMLSALIFGLDTLADLISIGTLSSYGIVSASVIILRYKDPARPYHSSLLTIVAMVCMAIASGSGLAGLHPAITAIFALIAVCLGVVIWRMKTFDLPSTFKCPWVPLVPFASMATSIHLMVSLGPDTWVRMGVWTVLGLSIYVCYGLRHSKVNSVPQSVEMRTVQFEDQPPLKPKVSNLQEVMEESHPVEGEGLERDPEIGVDMATSRDELLSSE